MQKKALVLFVLIIGLIALAPRELLACPICFGMDPDSDIARGANWAVFTLLGITGGVLSSFIAFIVHLMKKSREAIGHDHDSETGRLADGLGGSTFHG